MSRQTAVGRNRPNPKASRVAKRIAGFTLIEVMVALAVVSIGMLGIASLYTQTLGAARTTQYRSQAMNLLADMSDRIRGNRLGDAAYAGLPSDNSCDLSGGATCTPAELAADDLFDWNAQVAAFLPNGAGNIAFNGVAVPPTYTITVTWTEVGEAAAMNAATTVQLTTF